MKTVEIKVNVDADGRAHNVAPAVTNLSPGEHAAVWVVDDRPDDTGPAAPDDPVPPLVWGKYDLDRTDPNNTFRREDVYGDDGR